MGSNSVPFLATGYDASRKLYAAQKPYLEKQLASEGLMLLYSVPWPPQGLYAKREIKSVDDLKGLKFRTYNAMIGRIAALAGAIPTQIEVPDLPTAFATGRVDVMITSASTGVDTKSQDYLTHYIDTQAWLPRNIVIVNKEAFDKLSAAEKKAVTDAAKAAEDRGWKLSIEEMTIKTKALKDAGIIVLPPSPELKDGLAKIGPDHRRPNGRNRPGRWRGDAGGVQEVSACAHSTRFIAPRCGPRPSAWSRSRCWSACSSPARLLDGALALLHLPRTDFVILSLNEICGYLLAAASFLALARHAESRRAYPRHHGAGCARRARASLRRALGVRFCGGCVRLYDRASRQFRLGVVPVSRSVARASSGCRWSTRRRRWRSAR